MLHGQDETILPCLAMGGAQGGIGGTTNYNGKELVGIIEAWKNGNLDLAREHQNFAQEVINIICHFRGNNETHRLRLRQKPNSISKHDRRRGNQNESRTRSNKLFERCNKF